MVANCCTQPGPPQLPSDTVMGFTPFMTRVSVFFSAAGITFLPNAQSSAYGMTFFSAGFASKSHPSSSGSAFSLSLPASLPPLPSLPLFRGFGSKVSGTQGPGSAAASDFLASSPSTSGGRSR